MVPKNVAEILQDHVTFELEAIDRMYLNAYVPSLQTGAAFVYFLKTQLGVRVPSTVMVAPMSQRFVDEGVVPSLHVQYKKSEVKQYPSKNNCGVEAREDLGVSISELTNICDRNKISWFAGRCRAAVVRVSSTAVLRVAVSPGRQ